MPTTRTQPGDTTPSTRQRDTVEIDRSGPERYRYVCPNGHPQWDRTNNHIWCPGCRRQADHGEDVDPEHWHLLDQKEDELIHWSNIEIVAE